VKNRYIYLYDIHKKLLVETMAYDKNDLLQNDIVYKYDKKGNEISNVNYDKNKQIILSISSTYDSKNRKINVITQYEDKSIENEKFIYDKNDNIIERIISKNNQDSVKIINKYNSKGLIIEKQEINLIDNSKTVEQYEYTFYE
jgi:hypothetical protein